MKCEVLWPDIGILNGIVIRKVFERNGFGRVGWRLFHGSRLEMSFYLLVSYSVPGFLLDINHNCI